MPYEAEISRGNPSCFLFLIDQSGSMTDGCGGTGKKKADGVAEAINRLLYNLTIKCAKSEGVRDYYSVGVIAYSSTVGSGFSGSLGGQSLFPISLIAESPARIEERTQKVEDGAGGLVDQTVKFPVWFDPVAHGATAMCRALGQTKGVLEHWLTEHPHCFPPIVINITDGEATDGDPREAAREVRTLSSSDGDVLLFNVHLSSHRAQTIEYPDDESGLPDKFACLLFEMSSVLPPHVQTAATQEGYGVSPASRGFVFNADLVSLIRFLDIGTRPANLR